MAAQPSAPNEVAGAADLGATGFTLDAVVARTSVSKGAVLHHFPTKTARNARAYLHITVNEPCNADDVSLGRVVLAVCAMEPTLAGRWQGWVRQVSADDALMLVLRLMADGLWLSDLFGMH